MIESLRSLNQILNDYCKIIDPTSLNKQSEDRSISYRTGIYYTNESDLEIIQKIKQMKFKKIIKKKWLLRYNHSMISMKQRNIIKNI